MGSQARKVVPDPSQLRQGPMGVMLTLSGSPRPTCVPLVQARPVPDRGNQRIMLELTPTDPANKDSDLELAQTDIDYLTVNGHEIWILDFVFYVDFVNPTTWIHDIFSEFVHTAKDDTNNTNVIKNSVNSPRS